MLLIHTVEKMTAHREAWQRAGLKIGLVPTMGYLHEGHLSMVRKASAENDVVVVTIFVNPLQFGAKEDLSRYPQDMTRDLGLLEKENVSLVFNPSPEEMYPSGFESAVEVGAVTAPLEGIARPNHFRGVTTVCTKLFHLTGPHLAYFGQKDAQQVAVMKKMVHDLNFPLKIIVCPTVREPDGLALSSRNIYLTPEERKAASVLYRALQNASKHWLARKSDLDGQTLRDAMIEIITREPRAALDYASAANPTTLQEYSGAIPDGSGLLLSLAVRLGKTRLIDNFLFEENE